MKNPPWRYVVGAATIFLLFILLRTTYDSPPTLTRKVATSRADSETFGLESEDATEGATHNNTLGLIEDTLNSTLGFQKILAINLPERTDNRDALILAGALTDIDITFIDAVHGDTVVDKALPPGERKEMSAGNIGSWRAHINALQTIVRHNYTSALIVEDDVDWDIRLKPLLKDYALSLAALAHSPTVPSLTFDALPRLTHPPTRTPYGDDWDLLWLGHCGMMLPPDRTVLHHADASVPEPGYLASWGASGSPLAALPPHTRVAAAQVLEPVCSLAYAVSQRAARSLLYHLGLRAFDLPFDVSLRAWCQGRDGNVVHRCPGSLPPFFEHHRRVGSTAHDSDINRHEGWRDVAETKNIRWSVMMNLERLVEGATEFEDQWPDREGVGEAEPGAGAGGAAGWRGRGDVDLGSGEAGGGWE